PYPTQRSSAASELLARAHPFDGLAEQRHADEAPDLERAVLFDVDRAVERPPVVGIVDKAAIPARRLARPEVRHDPEPAQRTIAQRRIRIVLIALRRAARRRLLEPVDPSA